jgi:hypothetical protein
MSEALKGTWSCLQWFGQFSNYFNAVSNAEVIVLNGSDLEGVGSWPIRRNYPSSNMDRLRNIMRNAG